MVCAVFFPLQMMGHCHHPYSHRDDLGWISNICPRGSNVFQEEVLSLAIKAHLSWVLLLSDVLHSLGQDYFNLDSSFHSHSWFLPYKGRCMLWVEMKYQLSFLKYKLSFYFISFFTVPKCFSHGLDVWASFLPLQRWSTTVIIRDNFTLVYNVHECYKDVTSVSLGQLKNK